VFAGVFEAPGAVAAGAAAVGVTAFAGVLVVFGVLLLVVEPAGAKTGVVVTPLAGAVLAGVVVADGAGALGVGAPFIVFVTGGDAFGSSVGKICACTSGTASIRLTK
jgi:hypothetical protein